LFVSVVLAYGGIKGINDNSSKNDLLSAIQVTLGAALGGVALKRIAKAAGLQFKTSFSLLFTSFALLFTGAEQQRKAKDLQDELFGLILSALGFTSLLAVLGVSGAGLLLSIPLTISFKLSLDFVDNGGLDDLKKAFANMQKAIKSDTGIKSWFSGIASIASFLFPTLKANGGFVSTGEVFIAREAGPEMVGTIGGRTAVANNDQIVEGIRQGVYEAVVSAMNNSHGNSAHYTITLDGKVVYDSVVKEDKENVRRTGRSAFVY
jgi:hypothetical protein